MDVAVAPPANLQPPRRLRRRRRDNQAALIAWLDEQERLLRMRGTPDVVVQEFDPLHNLPEPQGDDVEQGRRTILFRFTEENLEGSIADQIQAKIVGHVRARFMLKLSSLVELRNIEDNTLMEFYQRPEESGGISPWFETLTASENWVRRQEEARLHSMRRPDTKWVYERTKIVYAKVILDRHPLFLGLGRLPDWLRNKRGVLSLDTYNDNRCLFRCIAVHWGAKVRDNMRRTRELEKSFFNQRPSLRGRLTERHLSLLEQHFKQGIAAYTVQPNGDFILTHLPANYDRVGRPVLTMGLYAGHAFLIKDLAQVARSYTCGGCQARFTKSSDLLRHTTSRCTGGQTKVVCPNNRIQFPPSAYEKAFYPESRCSFIAIKWLEWEARQRGIHIHHARCGHGGERKILGARVDGYHPETKTVFQYHGCFWHGCPQCYPEERSGTVVRCDKKGELVVRFDSQGEPMTRKSAYDLTLIRTKALKESGYRVVEKWEHETPTPWANLPCPEKQTATYPHAIVYDFEAYQDASKATKPTRNLTYESEHVPISVSLADTLNTEPEYIFSKDPSELLRLFHEALERRYEAILADVVARFRFSGTEDLTDAQSKVILQWVTQVPVVGFNSGHYDLKLIRKYYVPLMAKDKEVFAAEKNGRIMLKEYDDCHRIFREKGMRTFGDWLEYYNNLGVAPFLEALQKMKEFYTDLGVDIFKDAVSLPGVSKQYLLRKTLQPRRGYKPPELYVPNKEAYAMLKAAVVGGPSLVFTRKHVAGKTHIRSHQYEDAKVCRHILGYDANSLYPSTMMKEMPCGPGVVTTRNNPEAAALVFSQLLYTKEWFGFAEVDIEVPEELWPEFEEFPPLFVNRGVPDSAVPNHMHDYLKQSGRKRFPEQPKLLGVLSAKKILLYAPLLEWYLNRGLKLTAVYRTIDYEPREIFSWFVNEVADNRRKGDADKDKVLLAEVFKLLGNSAYGKFIEAVERQNRTLYTRDEEEEEVWFQDLGRLATPTRSSCARTRSSSRTHSRWVSWSTSSRSFVCSSSTTSFWTFTSTGGTSSSSRWTRTACTSHSPARSSRTPSGLGMRPSSRRT